jgi:hypothetical protein
MGGFERGKKMKTASPFLIIILSLSFTSASLAKQADFTKDGKVNLMDFEILAEAWRSESGWPSWNILCDISEPNDNVIDHLDLIEFCQNWLAEEILLKVYSDGWGTLLQTMTMAQEGKIIISVEEEFPYFDPPRYFVYAFRDGYYTKLYNCEKGDTISVDLDETVPGKFNGAIFLVQWYFSDSYLKNTVVNVLDGYDVVAQFQTDAHGAFAIDPLPPHFYSFEFNALDDVPQYHLETAEVFGSYQDFFFPWHIQAFKPNIYIYPEETIELDVDIIFPHGGLVQTAIPAYDNGWHVVVEPSGLIDGQYEYIFYESSQPDYSQYEAGWVVPRQRLKGFFINNMSQTGFSPREIADFIEYWIPRLTDSPYYAIYPQYNDELEEMIILDFTLKEPVIPPFTRTGFTVAEWGIILK